MHTCSCRHRAHGQPHLHNMHWGMRTCSCGHLSHGQPAVGLQGPSSLTHTCTLACASAAVATDRVANLLLAYKGRSSFMASNRAAEDIARHMAREVLVARGVMPVLAHCVQQMAQGVLVKTPFW
eukprot:scaffold9613_cov18-Tisochrysis_lutea.AAC.2